MSSNRAIDYEEVIKSVYPKGSIWKPKELVTQAGGTTNLVVNGDFATDLSGWTNQSEAQGQVTWSSGTALLSISGPA
jgi:hypothetical protein